MSGGALSDYCNCNNSALACCLCVTKIDTLQISCKAVTAILHYFSLAIFCWMLCEGIMLCVMVSGKFLVSGKFPEQKLRFYLLIGWGKWFMQHHITIDQWHDWRLYYSYV